MTISLPRVNMNGTSKAELLEQQRNAHTAICTAIDALARAAPHGRDYQTYPDGDDSYKRAVKQHEERLQSLVQIRGDLEELFLAIDAQGNPLKETP